MLVGSWSRSPQRCGIGALITLLLGSATAAAQPAAEAERAADPPADPGAEDTAAAQPGAVEGPGADASEPVAPSAAPATPSAEAAAPEPSAPERPAPQASPTQPSAVTGPPATTAAAAPEPPPEEPAEKRPYTGPPTLLGHGPVALGGYGGVSVQYTRIYDTDGVMVGGEGAFLIDHRLAIGGAGYGLATVVRGPDAPDGTRTRLHFGYGGGVIRYHFLTHSLVYLSAGTLIGGGGVTFSEYEDEDEWDVDERHEANGFFVLEPQLAAHMNITRWARVGLHASYRIVSGADLRGLHDADFRGPSAGGTVQFGWL